MLLVNVAAGAVAALAPYFVVTAYRDQSVRKGLAEMLKAEMRRNRRYAQRQNRAGSTGDGHAYGAHNGLLASSNIRYFDSGLQEDLLELYESTRANAPPKTLDFGGALTRLDCVSDRNTHRLWNLAGRALRRAAGRRPC